MDVEESLKLAMALSNGETAGVVSVLGISAICHELGRLGALDAAAIERIARFMREGLDRSAATENMRTVVGNAIAEQFGELASRLSETPSQRPS